MATSRAGSADRGWASDRRVGITPDKIIDAALELTRESGIGSWTQRDLATTLDVAPSVLYHHIGGRDQVIRGVVERVLGALVLPDRGLEWRAWFRELLTGMRPIIAAYPGTAKWLLMHGPSFPGVMRIFDIGIGKLQAAGFERPATAYSMLLNTAMLTISMADDRLEAADDGPRDHRAMLREFEPLESQSPGMARVIDELMRPLSEQDRPTETSASAAYFALLVDVMISGLEYAVAPRI